MGGLISTPKQPLSFETAQPGSSSSSDSTMDNMNSATVVVVGLPEPEMVGIPNTTIQSLITNNQENNHRRYMPNTEILDTPFTENLIHCCGPLNSGDDNEGDKNKGYSLFPGNYGPGGGKGDITPDKVADTFKLEYIGGLDDQKEYLQRAVILPLVRPEFFKEWGVSPPKGILLHGPPGTGKTFMAKALVNELKKELGAHVNFFYRKGGDVFSMWFGESQKKLRQVFETATTMAPSVIFFDEIDGLCPSRDGNHYHGTEAYSSVVTCFLGQMDGLENGKVFVIAATNRLDAVDPAVRRPGRFDKHLSFSFPDESARRKIIKIHTSKWSKADQPKQDLIDRLAQKTLGFSGADLEKLCKDVVYIAIEANGGVINNNLKITDGHWLQAMNAMQRTAVNNFGSSLLMPTKPNLIVSKLIEPVVNQAIEKIRPFLTPPPEESDSLFVFLHKSFLLYIQPEQSKSFLNNQILQGILSNPLFNKMSLFDLSTTTVTNKVLSGAMPTILGVIYDVINQAQDAKQNDSCAVVVVPNINELLEVAKANHMSEKLVLQALARIRGPNMFLLATSSLPLEEIREAGITELFFNRYMAAKNPNKAQLQEFFQFVLEAKKQAYPDKANLLNEVATNAAKCAENHNYERILNLTSALSEVNMESLNGNEAKQNFEDILHRYATSRLR